MKTTNIFLSFCALMFSVLSLSARAAPLDGGNSGGGGDIRCAEYSDIVGKIAYVLYNHSAERTAEAVNGIDPKKIWKVKQNLKCIPVTELNRQAFSYPKTGTTKLLGSAWEEMTYAEKVRLAAHELCVLAGYELDGQYALSETITQFLTLSLEIYGPNNHGIRYPDGSTFFQNAYAERAMVRGDTIEDADSLCKYLGLGSTLKFEFEPIHIVGTFIDTDLNRSPYYVPFATVRDGELISIERDRNPNPKAEVNVLTALTCGRAKKRPVGHLK